MRPGSISSLRGRMLLAFVGLLVVLELVVALGAHSLVHQNFDSGSNRILLGSVKTVAVAFAEPEPMRAKLMPMALKLLQRRARPIPHYSIYSGGKFIEGYPEILPPRGDERRAEVLSILGVRDTRVSEYVDPGDGLTVITPAYVRYGVFRGEPARIAAEIRRVPGFEDPVIIQIAVTEAVLMGGERSTIMYIVIAACLTLLIGVVLYWQATKWAVRPFLDLQAQLDARGAPSDFRFEPLAAAPAEAATFITAFNALLAELKDSAVAVRRFTSEASHQMRTPLAVLRTHLDLVRRYGVASNIGQEGLADMDGAIGTLERLLLQLISLARAEEASGHIDFREPFELAGIAAAAAADRFEQARANRIDLSFDGDEQGTNMVLGQPLLAKELIGNLIDNAIRYNRPGGSVVIRVTQMESICQLEVIDDGPGIPVAARQLVFDRFYRLPRDAERNGSGLGLPIVRALAERMSATVTLEDGRDGRGVTVVVDFQTANAAAGSGETRRPDELAA